MVKIGFTLLFISWVVFLTILSLFSFEAIDTGGITIPNIDKALHFTFYFVASVLGCMAIRENTKGAWGLEKAALIILFFCVLYGIIIEVFQENFTEVREGDFFDALANTLGASAGLLAVKFLFSGKTGLKWKI